MRQAALILTALAACHHAPAESQPSTPPPPPVAPARVACATSLDCAAIEVPAGFDCFHSCDKHFCQVEATTETVGAGPCFGEREAEGGTGAGEPGDVTVYFMCDALANLYCDQTTRRCAAVKPDHAACRESSECGLGSTCDPKVHVCTTQQLGEACGGDSCGRDNTCDEATHVCVARKPDGAACKSFGECLSRYCDHDKGVCARHVPSACTASL